MAHSGSVDLAVRLTRVILPNRTAAVIPAEKLSDYLLSPTHTLGDAKRRFFERLDMWLYPHFVGEDDTLKLSIHALLLGFGG
jgi:hypothetical protein